MQAMVETQIGFKGKWEDANTFRVDPIQYGYITPIQKAELDGVGLHMISSPITNTEWWKTFMPVSSCPRYKGHLLEIQDNYTTYCRDGRCEVLCEAEDNFVDLSAGRLRVFEDAGAVEKIFPRLHFYLERARQLLTQVNAGMGVGLALDAEGTVVRIHTRIHLEPESIAEHAQAFNQVFTEITQIQGKVNTAFLSPPPDFSDAEITENNVLQEARFYSLQEAVRLEALDILQFLVTKKGGHVELDEYYLTNDKIFYRLYGHKIEAYREGLYMGAEGFKKGVQELQKFFQTTLGGGRW